MKKIPTTTSSFRQIIEENYLYIDKTELIYNLISSDFYYFLARPRRFGKSLLISTLSELFSGNRDLFKGLWIDSSDYSWAPYPVISLDFSSIDNSSSENFKKSLALRLELKAEEYAIDLTGSSTPGDKLYMLVTKLAQQSKVVILIDEYDYPLVSNITDIPVAQEILKALSSFFSILKSLNPLVHAIFITGVSKFAKASVFSGLNNLNDISLDPIAATLLGFTEQELDTYFTSFITTLARLKGIPVEEIKNKTRHWYNGYRFSKVPEKVYNPFSVHYLLKKNEFTNYWFESGTPSFLIKIMTQQNCTLTDIEQFQFTTKSLGSFALDQLPLIPLLFQTGYLTINTYTPETDSYTLVFPNFEVKESFTLHLLGAFSQTDLAIIETIIPSLTSALENNALEKFCTLLKSLFAHIPYQIHIAKEAYYHSLFQLLVTLIEFKSQSEIATDKGRIDLVVITQKYIYIFEIKYNTPAEEALKQIEEHFYYRRYLLSTKTIILVGIAFNSAKHEIAITCASKILNRATINS
ncbi:AAA family ATPase [Candidatus Dependentiae bacterium]|nr:AAA family ATPase [Candidatus Dependentiae bacterium]